MSAFLNNIAERPLVQRVAILVGSLLFVVAIFWMYFYSPALTEYDKLSEEVDSLSAKIATEQRVANNLKRYTAEVKELDIKLKYALQELPDQREIPDLLNTVSNLAKDSGLEVNLFRTKPEAAREFYAEVPVEIDVAGNYHQVASFFDEVGRLSRIVNVSNIYMRDPKVDADGFSMVKIGCTATTFRYLDESERVRQAAPSAGKRRKRK